MSSLPIDLNGVASDEEQAAELASQPFSIGVPTNPSNLYVPTSITRIINDDRVIMRLLETIIMRAGLTNQSAADRLGMDVESLRPYLKGKRNPSLRWLLRLCQLCGAELQLKLPEKPLR